MTKMVHVNETSFGGRRFLSAEEAARALGVSRATLYAYVSRGLIRSEPLAQDSRRRRYHAGDIRRHLQRKAQRREPSLVAAQALHFGAPVLTSTLTLIDGEQLYYRGRDVLQLAVTRSVEEVAGLLWCGEWDCLPSLDDVLTGLTVDNGVDGLTTLEQFQRILPQEEAADMAAFELSAEAVRATAARILALLTVAAAGVEWRHTIVSTLVDGWDVTLHGAERLLTAALILCADHELNVSSFTARCVASAGSTPYQVVLAGLAALQGSRHGGHTSRVATLLDEIREPQRTTQVLRDRLRRGDPIPGFGHPLYEHGDPRARLLLDLIADAAPENPATILAQEVEQQTLRLTKRRPNIDFGLVVLASLLGLARDGGLTIFALGRTIGWIAHAMEQYASGHMIRPRARYLGPLPDEANEGMV